MSFVLEAYHTWGVRTTYDFKLVQKFQFGRTDNFVQVIIDNLFSTICELSYLPSACLKIMCSSTWVVQSWKLFWFENFFSKILSLWCEQAVAGFWTKSDEVLKSQSSSSSSFSTEVTSKAEAKNLFYIEMVQTFEKDVVLRIFSGSLDRRFFVS